MILHSRKISGKETKSTGLCFEYSTLEQELVERPGHGKPPLRNIRFRFGTKISEN